MTFKQEMEERRERLGGTRADDFRPDWMTGVVLGTLALLILGALILTYPDGAADRVRTTEHMHPTEQVPSTK